MYTESNPMTYISIILTSLSIFFVYFGIFKKGNEYLASCLIIKRFMCYHRKLFQYFPFFLSFIILANIKKNLENEQLSLNNLIKKKKNYLNHFLKKKKDIHKCVCIPIPENI